MTGLWARWLGWLLPVSPPVMARVPQSSAMPLPMPAVRSSVPPPPALLSQKPSEAFTPTQPKRGRRSVTGRQRELARILQALWEEQAHVVLYTDRGRGKTTLANLVVETLRLGGVIVARHTCEVGSTFSSVVRALARDLPHSLLAVSPSATGLPGCEGALPPGELRPRDVVALPGKLTCRRLVCVVDEFDRIEDPATRTCLADTIKQLSEGAVPLAFLIVGVSKSLEQMLGQHPSIQRNLVVVPLPFLRDAEVAQLIGDGMTEAGLAIEPEVAAQVCRVVRGSPYMAQLVGLRLTQAAKLRGTASVSGMEFAGAVAQMVEEAPLPVLAAYAALTTAGTDIEMVRLVCAVAAQPQDGWGRLAALPAIHNGVMIGETLVGADRWDRLLKAGFVCPATEYAYAYTFPDRALMHYVLLLAMLHQYTAANPASNLVRHVATAN